MTEESIVLILGAGSSLTYGLPLGEELVREICKNAGDILLNLIAPDRRQFEKNLVSARAEEFTNALHKSSCDSIDDFLSGQARFQTDGKYCISNILLSCEDEDKLFSRPDDNWYPFLKNWIFSSSSPDKNKAECISMYYF